MESAPALSSNLSNKDIKNPPGGLMVWIFISAELVTFGGFFMAYLVMRSHDLAAFKASQALLDAPLATINTMVLITSGYFAAQAVSMIHKNKHKIASYWFAAAAGFGVVFLIIKGTEYAHKMSAGLSLSTDTFFSFYWLMTLMHFVHVIMGIVILIAVAVKSWKGDYSSDNMMGAQTGAAFWHMCDLIWIILYPLLYLLP